MIKFDDSQAGQLAPRLHKEVLANGLTVITRETPGTGVATVQIWVRAGSIYEKPHQAGITHYIEHMIFKGTEQRGPGEVAGAIETLGGRINAYTSYEHTVYHATLDARHWAAALEVLADAVLNSVFDPEEMEREKPVIFEEIRMRQDRPEILIFEKLLAHAYRKHPYRLPIIGSKESVAAIDRDDILAYLAEHYHPDNLTVVVVGDLKAEEVTAQSRELFGHLTRRPEAVARELPVEPLPDGIRYFYEEQEINQTHLALAFPIPAFSHPDTPVLSVLAQILGQGEASRLNERLRHEQGLVYRISAAAFSAHDPGLLRIGAVLDAPKAPEVIQNTLAELFALRHFPVSDEELERARRNLEADFVFNLERAEGMARVLGSFELLTGDPREHEYLERIRAVEAADIQRVAATWFREEYLTAGLLAPRDSAIELDEERLARLVTTAAQQARQTRPRPAQKSDLPPHTHRYQLANGLTLLVREQPDVPTVAIRAVLPGGLRGETPATNGAFAFLSELLPRGAGKLDARQMARTVADLAGELDGFNGRNTFGVKGDFLARFFDQGLMLVRDVLLEPAFDPEEAEKIRAELLANLRRQEDSLPSVGMREFNRALFRSHPYALNTLGSTASLESLDLATLKEIYRQHTRPDRLVLAVVGDVDAEGVRLQVEQLFGDWQPVKAAATPATTDEPAATATANPAPPAAFSESLLPPEPPLQPEVIHLSREREQVHIIIGFLGATLDEPDRYPLEILDQVLSGQSGRLFSELRDRQSLAYSLSSFNLLGTDTGSFGVYIGTSPQRREEAVKELWGQIYRLRSEPVSPAELERARNVLVGNYRLGLQSNGAQAMELALNETYGLGLDFSQRYPAALEAVSAEDVRDAARRYLQPERYIMVTVGGTE